MNIMVFNVPAETVGALSILNEFYGEVRNSQEKIINWTFVLSKPTLEETENIRVLRFPWVKKSWLHRLYFDNIIAPRLIKDYKIDKVISYQNIIIPNTDVTQTLYVHNCLPFIDYKFSLKENRHLWIYQNIISRKIIKSIKKADKVIVQTKWMKEAIIEKTNVESEKIKVVPPKINLAVKQYFKPNEESYSTFFYPASEFVYKNHKVIVEACKKLKSENINFKVIFTLDGNENENIANLYQEVKKYQLPIEFVGNLQRDKVFEFYTKSILLFPSFIETFGLPLLEARLHRGLIIASDCPFSHEVLDGYKNAYFFEPFDSNKLAELLFSTYKNKVKYIESNDM
ncbi:glycosyltransferase [Ureibacillus sp. MALMAid1270]|uniref:glycosyltransferase n=1 Tax=Ureibacillus sp. MALMAid1270 TaxID=3411629 RepID=UPI003BA5361F